eukprot:XP_011677241.1 PREDICTED: sperm-associated antigen 8 [Strongylocentrotus purpuratus]
MATLNPARTLNNSGGRCLMENWVEERQVFQTGLDSAGVNSTESYTSNSSLPYKDGHKGILTRELDTAVEKESNSMGSYQRPAQCGVRTVGRKKELMERALYAKVSQELQEEINDFISFDFFFAQGVSQIKTLDTPFKKNSAFSKPIAEGTDQPQPYEQETHPFL